MKKTILIALSLILVIACDTDSGQLPRVFVFTDINIDSGDPDDRQSLIHLCWYTDEVEVEGIIPDRWNAQGYEACSLVLEAYAADFTALDLIGSGFTDPIDLGKRIARDPNEAQRLFLEAASKDPVKEGPLYVLVWGNMRQFGKDLSMKPELAANIRLITIGTGLMREKDIPHLPPSWPKAEQPCEQYNWNGFGRDELYENPDYHEMWWLEINWTYAGMFSGEEPGQMFEELSQFGHLGKHMKEVVRNESWAQYFRVGDTPSLLYVIDPDHSLDNPEEGSWAGKFIRPFPVERPNYYTDFSGPVEWDYRNPCDTWENHEEFAAFARSTLEKRRDSMYAGLLEKLERIYR